MKFRKYFCTKKRFYFSIEIQSQVSMSGWPSGLRRQTQDLESFRDGVFWSTYVGVGSNPTSDKSFVLVKP